MVDVDSLKWFNDNIGHDAGDELLRKIADSFAGYEEAYRISGDEFVLQGKSEEEVGEAIRKAYAFLGKHEFLFSDGETNYRAVVGFSYGEGSTLNEADERLQKDKANREAEGLRAERGQEPPGLHKETPEREAVHPEEELAPSTDVTTAALRVFDAIASKTYTVAREGGVRYEIPREENISGDIPLRDRHGAEPAHIVSESERSRRPTLFVSEEKPQARPLQAYHAKVGTLKSDVSRVKDHRDAAHIFSPLQKKARESAMVLALDKDRRPIAVLHHSLGKTGSTQVDPKILAGSLHNLPGVESFWFAHNHPSGDINAMSPEDMDADQGYPQHLHQLRTAFNPQSYFLQKVSLRIYSINPE